MEFDLSSTQRMMQQAARTFLTKECPSTRVRKLMASDTAFDPELWSVMADQGWLGIAIDEEHGGLGQSAIELAVIAEEMGRACLPGPFVSHVWGTSVLAECNPAARKRWLPELCAGKRRATVALVEEPPSWAPEAVKLSLETSGGAGRLSGLKRFVGDAATSDLLLCVARDNAEPVIVAVASNAAGVTITRRPAMDATRKVYDVRLQNVALADDAIVARGAEAERALSRGMQMATLVTCGELVGVMSCVLEMAVQYVKTRKQFDRLVGSFQAIQQQCVDMLLWLESSRSATYYAAWTLASGASEAAVAVSTAKAYASDAGREVVNRGVQVHGGIGFTWEHDLQLYYKRAKSNEILLGDAIYHREQVAREILSV